MVRIKNDKFYFVKLIIKNLEPVHDYQDQLQTFNISPHFLHHISVNDPLGPTREGEEREAFEDRGQLIVCPEEGGLDRIRNVCS